MCIEQNSAYCHTTRDADGFTEGASRDDRDLIFVISIREEMLVLLFRIKNVSFQPRTELQVTVKNTASASAPKSCSKIFLGASRVCPGCSDLEARSQSWAKKALNLLSEGAH